MKLETRKRWAWVATFAPILIGVLGMGGWLIEADFLKTLVPGGIPMAPNTALSFVVLGAASALRLPPGPGSRRWWMAPIEAIPALVALVALAGAMGNQSVLFDTWVEDSHVWLGSFPTGRMSPVTAILFLTAAASLWTRRHSGISAVVAASVSGAGLFLVVGYFYGIPLFYEGNLIPPALNTSLGFFLWGLGTFLAVGPDSRRFDFLFGERLRSRLFRNLIPLILFLVLLDGWAGATLVPEGALRAVDLTILSMVLAGFIVLVIFVRARGIEAGITRMTDRLQAEQADLRGSEAKFRLALDLAPFPLMIHAEDGKIELVNQAWTRLTGYTQEDIPTIGDWTNAAYGERGEAIEKMILSSYRTGALPARAEYQIRTKAGATLVWEFQTAPLGPLPDGRRTTISMATDVTGHKEAAEAAMRSQHLDSLGSLAGGLAHDFNNLLASLYGFLALARLKTNDEAVARPLDKATRSLQRAQDLTRQILTFAKGGAPVLEVGPMAPLVEETVRFALSGSSIEVQFDIAQDLPSCVFDRHQMAQVIDNLVINALQAMPGGGVLSVGLQKRDQNGVLFSIADTGPGIPPEILPRIFDPFFTTKTQGHGLGLSTCYSIVRRHGGTIDVESHPGRGTTVSVGLPTAPLGTRASVSDLPAAEHRGQGWFIVMDDDDAIRDVLTEELTAFGYRVEATKDGKEALEALVQGMDRGLPCVGMLLDLTVSGGNGGLDIIGEILAIDSTLDVYLTTGYAEDPALADPTRFGFRGGLAKPFTRQDLARLLNHQGT